jgi:hypothetical protein
MSAESICDGCGRRAPMACYHGSWHKPDEWFERTPFVEGKQETTITACSRDCIEKVEAKRKEAGKQSTGVVAPF